MEKLLGKLPQIIREASRNPLGLVALIILILFLLIFSFFYDASVTVKLIVTLTIVIVAILIVVMIYKLEVKKLASNTPVNETASQQESTNPLVDNASQITLKVQIVATQLGSSPPFPVQATTIEEDTYLLLSTKNNVKSAREHHERTIGRAIEYKPQKTGSVLVKEEPSLQFLAIVYDFDREPFWDEQWISVAISEILKETETRQLQSISLPMLGTFHSSMDKKHFCELLNMAIKKTNPTSLKKIWLIVPAATKSEDLSALQDFKFI